MVSRLAIQLLPGARAPQRASKESAGYDLFAYHDAVISPGESLLVSSGIRLAIPPGLEAQVRPRSGLSLRTRLRIANSPGTIDADYRGLVSVICENTASLLDPLPLLLGQPGLLDNFANTYSPRTLADYLGHEKAARLPEELVNRLVYLDCQGYPLGTLFIKAGERIAQLIFARIELPELYEVDDVSVIGHDRGVALGRPA